MSRRSWILVSAAIGISVVFAGALIVVELTTTRIDPEAEFRASSRQIAGSHRHLRGVAVGSEAELAKLKSSISGLLYGTGRIVYMVPLSLPGRIARLAPHSVDPARCRAEALANAVALGQWRCDDSEPAAVGRCLVDLLGALSRAFDRYCRPRRLR